MGEGEVLMSPLSQLNDQIKRFFLCFYFGPINLSFSFCDVANVSRKSGKCPPFPDQLAA